jgi:hypothetical protein
VTARLVGRAKLDDSPDAEGWNGDEMRRSMVLAALAALLTAAACSLPGSQKNESPSEPPATSETAPPPSGASSMPASPGSPVSSGSAGATPPGGPASGTSVPSGTSSDQLGQVVASRTTSLGGKAVQVDLHPLVRDGNLTHVQLTVSSKDDLSLWNTFSDNDASAGNKQAWAADGITLVDTVHNKLYLVASDGHGSCLCSQNLGSVELKDELPVLVSASFATPPPEMTEIGVQIPNFGVFPHVPIS